MVCPSHEQLEAFHDGELDPASRDAIERHVAGCDACGRQLAQLRAVSTLLTRPAATQPLLSQLSLARLHHNLDAVMDERGVLRIAWTLSGIAASVLLVGSLWLMKANGTTTSPTAAAMAPQPVPPPWVEASLSSSSRSLSRDAVTPAAEWYLADASRSSDDVP